VRIIPILKLASAKGGGSDVLRGPNGNDYLNGGPGADSIVGDAGNDQIFAVDGAIDQIDGGADFDRVKTDANDVLTRVEGVLA
jgi:Ca2+-binding RTX toxin-like protein